MQARKGDHLVIRGHHVGESNREAEILEARGAGGQPPYLIRWLDDGHVGLLFPGPDATIEHVTRARRSHGKAAR